MNCPTLAPEATQQLHTAPSTLLQEQLFRYAQDMQELMTQYGKLQTNFKMVLQSMGRQIPSDDVLPRLLLESAELYFVTDSQGIILSSSMAASNAFCLGVNDLRGIPIDQLFSKNDRAMAKAVVDKFANGRPPGGVEQRTLCMLENLPSQKSSLFDLLVMQMQKHSRRELIWFIKDSLGTGTDPLQVQQSFLSEIKSEEGLLITDPYGTICAVNQAFCKISGYAEDEIIGKNPRMMSSGRHETSFYQEFWIELLGNGNWSGEIFNRRKNGQIFLEWESIKMVEDERGNAISYIATVSDLSHRDAASSDLSQLAYHDPLTGLPNRRLLEERIMKAMSDASQDSEGLSIFFLDLDKFKLLNDSLGHQSGDVVLQTVANRLKETVRQGDTVARVGGDEFVILLPKLNNAQHIEILAEKVIARLAEPIQVEGGSIQIGASVGCAQYPRDGSDMGSLLKSADAAMYGAKRFGTGFSHFETGASDKKAPSIGFEIWGALGRNELQLVYQPQVDAISGACRGCEVLLRWNHPVLGEVAPSTFIPVAEQNGAILSIGNWVLESACTQLGEWIREGIAKPMLTVNVSLRQLREPSFAAHVAHCIAQSGVPPECLEFDLGETDALQYREEDFEYIQLLRHMGVRVAINDFGAAVSRLAKLHDLSVSCLKISPRLVEGLFTNEDAQKTSKCFVALANAMDMELVAGGVETPEQLNFLLSHGCRLIQGYLTGRPMTPTDFADFLREAHAL